MPTNLKWLSLGLIIGLSLSGYGAYLQQRRIFALEYRLARAAPKCTCFWEGVARGDAEGQALQAAKFKAQQESR